MAAEMLCRLMLVLEGEAAEQAELHATRCIDQFTQWKVLGNVKYIDFQQAPSEKRLLHRQQFGQ